MKIYIICSVLAQIPYFGTFLFLRYGPKCSEPVRCRIFESTISLEQINKVAWFFACSYKFSLSKSWSKNFGVGAVKNGSGQSGHRTVSQDCTCGVNRFF